MNYREFFHSLTGEYPYPYQHALGTEPWPDIIDVPTGLGKTAAVAVAWLYRRATAPDMTPRRLVYCLPMRVLVEQTATAIEEWIQRGSNHFAVPPTVHRLMGGETDAPWAETPERPTVIIGTQDMLLSRALMRGYGMNRHAWPVHYAWLHNDALWIFDEIQLMGVGVETSAQLQGLRDSIGTRFPTHSIWMSATVGRAQLETVDHREPSEGWTTCRLEAPDEDRSEVLKKLDAKKEIHRSELQLAAKKDDGYAEGVAERALELHQEGTLTLIIVNRVARATAIYEALRERRESDTVLIHSRFRPVDRAEKIAALQASGDRIVVSTQVVEAGVDIDATTMITELAPWPSLVQRFGRCNRRGEGRGRIEWIDFELTDGKAEGVLPYDIDDLRVAQRCLEGFTDASPRECRQVSYTPPVAVRPVVRRKDLLELFDTQPDLTGHDLNIARFVRDDRDNDVAFYWRDLGGAPPTVDLSGPRREELCRVPIGQARDFLKKATRNASVAWEFDYLEREWRPRKKDVRPQATILLDASAAGYDPALGFTADPRGAPVPTVPAETLPPTGLGNDPQSVGRQWMLIREHLDDVAGQADAICADLAIEGVERERITTAARWHDAGKAHQEFQRRLKEPAEEDPGPGPFAKSNHRRRAAQPDPSRRHFRHELASALAFRQLSRREDRALIAYLIAAHHGKVRITIRSLPGEEAGYAMGVRHDDVLPALDLGGGYQMNEVALDLSCLQIGPGSWREDTLSLLTDEEIGPFRLALWESLVRVADWRGSSIVTEET